MMKEIRIFIIIRSRFMLFALKLEAKRDCFYTVAPCWQKRDGES